MQTLRVSTLVVGQVLLEPLFTRSGQKLLGAGVPLTPRQVEALQRSGEFEVITAKGVEELVEAGIIERFDSSGLRVGQRAGRNVLSRHGQVLVERDQEIEQHHIDAMNAGGGSFANEQSPEDQRRQRIIMADPMVDALQSEVAGLSMRVVPAEQVTWRRPCPPSTWPRQAELTDIRGKAVERLRSTFARIEAGVPVPLASFDPILNDLTERLTGYPTRFTQLALMCPRREDYLPDHAYTTAVLAMAIADRLQWPLANIREMTLAALLADLGMLLVPHRIRTGGCELSDIDRGRVNRHPAFSLVMMETIETVPAIVRLAALQHHERENGSGYPRGASRQAICDYARVLAVADSFAATTEPRHYRSQKMPYLAVEEMVRGAAALLFWTPAARAMVQAAGLFPVGSFLKLSDGRNAHVIAANPRQSGRPTVQPLDEFGAPDGAALDLTDPALANLTIVRPLPTATG